MLYQHDQQTRLPLVRAIDKQRRFKLFDTEAVTPIVDSAEVDGGYAIWLHEAASGTSPPRHIHHREDEIFHLLEGRLLLWCDGQTYEAGAGDTVCLPKGLPHTWLVTSTTPVKLLAMVVPGEMMSIFDQIARLGTGDDALPESTRLMEEFGLEIVGPPLEA
jgi:quercetin dioxygenase-like cupin family protein